jgi:KDO2-lipid IV(A) lauroyltransferase
MTRATESPVATDTAASDTLPKRWTFHSLNNGLIFSWTVRGVRRLPRAVSYAIGHVGTWMAWRAMRATNAAVASNLAVVVPDASARALERAALDTYRHYAYDTIDFLRALSASPDELERTFDLPESNRKIFEDVLAQGRGGLLVTGHYGNWEAGGILMSRVVRMPLTVVAMAESDEDVNRLRREIRDQMGINTLEVRQSLETALQIRRLLAENRFVAMLIDRHLGRDRVAVTFFGRRTWFLQTPALLGYMTGAPLVTCFLERDRPGHFTTKAIGPFVVDRSLPRNEAVQRATQQIATAIEERVRANPHSWYHFYRYWDAQDDRYDGLD